MTEDEARMRMCCGPLVVGASIVNGNRIKVQPPMGLCIASACMAWRTRQKLTGVTTSVNDGYCGLAGRP